MSRRQPLASVDVIAGNDDLMSQVLKRLPAKSLCRFKSVSKHWYSLISHPHFSLLRMPHSTSGFFLSITSYSNTPLYIPLYRYIHLSGTPLRISSHKIFTFGDNSFSFFNIVHSCNGLFLLSSSPKHWGNPNYYIYNPTTKQSAIIPTSSPCDDHYIPAMNLVFDPSRAPHYRIVLVHSSPLNGTGTYRTTNQIEIYSSETQAWRVSGDPFPSTYLLDFTKGIFFNGSIHWLNSSLKIWLRFDIDKECLETMTIPTTQDGKHVMDVSYFGESGGHLYLIGRYNFSATATRTALFDVLEMESDYSNLVLKYRVDLYHIVTTFLDCPRFTKSEYSILHLLPGEEEEESSLVLRIGAMVVSYNFKDKSVKKLCNLVQCGEWSHTHHYIENLFCI